MLPERNRERIRKQDPETTGSSKSRSEPAHEVSTISDVTSPDLQPVTVYNTALQKISDNDRAFFVDHDGLDECLARARILQQLRYGERLKWRFRGSEHNFQQAADVIVSTIDQLKSVGDGAVLLFPQAAVPWAVLKVLLKVAVDNKKQRDFLTQGIERAIFCYHRLLVYEQELGSGQASQNLWETLVTLNVKILEFLAIAMRAVQHNRAVAFVQPLWTLPRIEKFDEECSTLLAILAQDAASRGRVVFAERHIQVVEKLDAVLDHLFAGAVAEGATHMSKEQVEASKCLPDTRTELLGLLRSWMDNNTSIFWLCGQAGTGKSTISRTVAQEISSSGYAVASFFFKRTEARRSHARYLFATIVQQLVEQIDMNPPLRTHALLTDRGLDEQWRKLIEEPLPEGLRVFLVIDALDECALQDVKNVLKVLFAAKVPLKIFLTSRPEVEIVRWFQQGKHESFRLEEIAETISRHDIRLFIRHELSEVSEDVIEVFTDMTSPLFIAASTLCKFICQFDPEGTIQKILEDRQLWSTGMVDFYSSILHRITSRFDKVGKDRYLLRFHAVVPPLIVLADPLHLESLAKLLGTPASAVSSLLDTLRSVLSIDSRIRPLHLTFYESGPEFESPFTIDEDAAHDVVCRASLKLLDAELKQDYFGLRHPGTKRKDVRVEILDEIQYACTYWPRHMRTYNQLYWFLSTHLLHWLEAMSWLERLGEALDALTELSKLDLEPELKLMVQDSTRFLQQNLHIIGDAPLQTYLGALAYTPRDSKIMEHYSMVLVSNPYIKRLPPSPVSWSRTIWHQPVIVQKVCVNDDGTRLAVQCNWYGSLLCLIDLRTGMQVLQTPIRPPQSGMNLRFVSDVEVCGLSCNDAGTHWLHWDLNTGAVARSSMPGFGHLRALPKDFSHGIYSNMRKSQNPTGLCSCGWLCLVNYTTMQHTSLRNDPEEFLPHQVVTNSRTTALILMERSVVVHDNRTGELLWCLPTRPSNIGIALSPDSRLLAFVPESGHEIQLLQISDTVTERTPCLPEIIKSIPLRGKEDKMNHVYDRLNFHTIGGVTFVGHKRSDSLYLESVSSEERITFEGDHDEHLSACQIRPLSARRFVFHTQRGGISMLSRSRGRPCLEGLAPPEEQPEVTNFVCETSRLAIATSNEVLVYDQDATLLTSCPNKAPAQIMIFTPDEKYLIWSWRADSKVRISVWKLPDGPIQEHEVGGHISRLEASPGSSHVLCDSEFSITCFNLRTGTLGFQCRPRSRNIFGHFTNDNRGLLTWEYLHKVNMYRYILRSLEGHSIFELDSNQKGQALLRDLRARLPADQRDWSVSKAKSQQAKNALHLDESGWIKFGDDDVLWVPVAQRAARASNETMHQRLFVLEPRRQLAMYVVHDDIQERLELDAAARAGKLIWTEPLPPKPLPTNSTPEPFETED